LQQDRDQYQEAYPTAEKPKPEKRKSTRVRTRPVLAVAETEIDPEMATEREYDEYDRRVEPSVEPDSFTQPHHNELEDFLL
jgi:hypothetical protein